MSRLINLATEKGENLAFDLNPFFRKDGLTPQSEYRPTEYVQGWMSFWFDEEKRLKVAKRFQQSRIEYLKRVWSSDRDLQNEGLYADDNDLQRALTSFSLQIEQSTDVTKLLLMEAQPTKNLYKISAYNTRQKGFVRQHDSEDTTNAFLSHGKAKKDDLEKQFYRTTDLLRSYVFISKCNMKQSTTMVLTGYKTESKTQNWDMGCQNFVRSEPYKYKF